MHMSDPSRENDMPQDERRYGPLRAFFTVLAAFFGVQSSANKARDDKHGSMGMFISLGLLATALLVAAIWALVFVVMMQAG